ncbi:MAG: thioredoxin domain-containing protein [Actinomycetota bacterium]|nr:thioredoxin domain-containing protein [Actinomycetota bacterium]
MTTTKGGGSAPSGGGGSKSSGPKSPAPNTGPKVSHSGRRATGRPSAQSGRQSVAAARRNSSNSNRTQLIIGGIAVVVIAAIVVLGLVLNKKNNAVQGAGYGSSTASTAKVSGGVISVGNNNPAKSIDVYEDFLCPICGEFESQYGQQIAQFADQGKLQVNIHMINFLDSHSASKDYSSRAAAALLAVATEAGDKPGLVLKFHSALYASGTQPTEGGSTDLTNAQLAALAIKDGAPASVGTAITSGKYLEQVKTNATTFEAQMQRATGTVGTPTVLNGGKPVSINDVNWLSNIVNG